MSFVFFFFSSRRRHTRSLRDWSSDVCSSDLLLLELGLFGGLKLLQLGLVDGLLALRATSLLRLSRPFGRRWLRALLLCRSEERRVGKECRFSWSRGPY